MSVLIKGVKKPKTCNSRCPVSALFCNLWQKSTGEHIPADCPLIELPDHGDLVDRDELKNSFYRTFDTIFETEFNYLAKGLLFSAHILNNAPTVIPAERSKE